MHIPATMNPTDVRDTPRHWLHRVATAAVFLVLMIAAGAALALALAGVGLGALVSGIHAVPALRAGDGGKSLRRILARASLMHIKDAGVRG